MMTSSVLPAATYTASAISAASTQRPFSLSDVGPLPGLINPTHSPNLAHLRNLTEHIPLANLTERVSLANLTDRAPLPNYAPLLNLPDRSSLPNVTEPAQLSGLTDRGSLPSSTDPGSAPIWCPPQPEEKSEKASPQETEDLDDSANNEGTSLRHPMLFY